MPLQRALPAGFIPPCLPTSAKHAPSGPEWLHERSEGLWEAWRKNPLSLPQTLLLATANESHRVARSGAPFFATERAHQKKPRGLPAWPIY
jgi:hypothetical protein